MPSTGAASLLWDGKLWAASLRLNEDGTINLSLGASDTGQGSNTVMAQIAADTIGVPAQWVMVSGRDTDVSPLGIGNCASRTTSVVGNAVRQAALKIREAWVPGHTALSFAGTFAEVEVEPATGRVRVTRLVSAHDVGRAINPMLIEGQMEGAMQIGLGQGLGERVIVEGSTGPIVNPSFLKYGAAGPLDMSAIETIIVESLEPDGPFGAKGVGEVGTVPVAGAIANAVYNATGIRIRDLPITPDKIIAAFQL